MSYNDGANRWQSWLHRRGIARRLNSERRSDDVRYRRTYVETRLPLAALARVANRWDSPRLVSCERVDRWRWRWMFRNS